MRNTSLLVAPAEPAIENDLPLDLSCNARRSPLVDASEDDDCRALSAGAPSVRPSIGGPPSPPRSPADFRLLDLGYVVYHQQLLAKERQRQWQRNQQQQQHDVDDDDDDDEDEDVDVDVASPCGHDSDDSDSQPIDLGANPKAYKKSLMKRYRKSLRSQV